MKTSVRVLAAVFLLSFVGFARAGDFVSQVLQPTDTPIMISVPGNRFLVIRNFTQQAFFPDGVTPSAMRGSVSVTEPFTANVLAASFVDTTVTFLQEPVNDVVVGGPATVKVTPGDTTCFITYRKGED